MKKTSKWLEKHGESFVYIMVTVITIACAAMSNVFTEGTVGIVVNIGFYAGFSVDMLLIMWNFPKIKAKADELTKYVKQEECIHFDAKSKKNEESKFNDIIEEKSSGRIYIFCYGTNLYGDFISEVIDNNKDHKKDFRINLVVCNPNSKLISERKNEIKLLNKNITYCISNIQYFDSLYLMSTPKTFRACMVKDLRGKPLRACFQSYIISEDRFMSTKKSRTPIISACKNNGDVLACIEEILDREWEDIKESSDIIKVIDGGELTTEGENFINNQQRKIDYGTVT